MMHDSDVTSGDNIGRRTAPDAITLERTLNAPIERVWALLTTPGGLALWMGESAVVPRDGGEFIIRLTPEVTMRGTILEFEPPRHLRIAWREFENGTPTRHATTNDDTSELSFTLAPLEHGTRFTLVHRLIRSGDTMIDFGAGWHAYLDSLQARLDEATPVDPYERYAQLRPTYAQRLGA